VGQAIHGQSSLTNANTFYGMGGQPVPNNGQVGQYPVYNYQYGYPQNYGYGMPYN